MRLIDGDEAERLIEAAALAAENTHSLAVAYGHRLAGDVVRAQPSVGTCETCAEWDTANRASSTGGCCNRTRAHELRDHSCAAWRTGP